MSVAEVRLQEGESIDNALRRFKRKVQTEDIIGAVKRHSYYLKPGDRRRVKQAYFPKLAEAYEATASPPTTTAISHPAPSSTGIATILLVEDESGLRKLMTKVLERQNYQVLEAKDGEEALSIC